MAKEHPVVDIFGESLTARMIDAGERFALVFRPRDPADFPAEIQKLKGRVAAWQCCDRGRETNQDGERLWIADDPAFHGTKVPEGDLRSHRGGVSRLR